MKTPRPASGFSLVEITIALGLVSFVLIALLGLLSDTVKKSRSLTSEHQAHSAFGALEEYFATATNGYLSAASFPSASAPPICYAITSVITNDRLSWTVNSNAAATDKGPYRYLAGLNISPLTNSTNAFRVLVRAELYPLPSGSKQPASMRPEYVADFSVTR